jgi:hypothetical protein
MRFSLLSLFGVMTAMALVLGLPVVLYAMGGWIVVTAAAIAVLIAMFHFIREAGVDLLLSMTRRRPRLEDWNLPNDAERLRELANRAAEVREQVLKQESEDSTRDAVDTSERE